MVDAQLNWALHVKYGSQQLEVALPPSAKIQELQEKLQEVTGAFIRKQKLIYKGKVLAANLDLAKAGLSDGAKLMLLLSDGAAVATQGQQALQQQKRAKQDEVAQRVRDLYAQAKGLGGAAATAIAAAAASAASAAQPSIDWPERKRAWEKTGIIALRDLGLSTLPEDLFASGLEAARVADLSRNRLECLPEGLSRLTGLHTLRLEHNCLAAGGLPWEALGRLSGLTALSLDHNRLEGVAGEALGELRGLRVLGLSHNSLTALPESLGGLMGLQVLAVDENKLESLPENLGGCTSLEELSAEGNRIRQLPARLAELQKLQSLRLDGNMITSVPPAVLRDCASLATLSLQGNPITADQLRSTPGFAEYDARRVARCNKQLDAGVLQHATRTFTEGAEDMQWARWAGPGPRGGAGQGGGAGGQRG